MAHHPLLLRVWIGLVLLLAAAPAAGADVRPRSMPVHGRLAAVPGPEGILADYEADVRQVFRDGFAEGVVLRAIVRPSFATEFLVGLRIAGGGYEIFGLRPERQIWAYQGIRMYKSGRAGVMVLETPADGASGKPDDLLGDPAAVPVDRTAEEIDRLEKDLPADPGDLPLKRCAAAVDAGAAAALTAAWRRMLDAVRPEEELMPGADGTFYLFSMEAQGRALSGETWSPHEGTRPAKLARLAEAILDYCEAKAPERLAEIEKLAKSLAGGP